MSGAGDNTERGADRVGAWGWPGRREGEGRRRGRGVIYGQEGRGVGVDKMHASATATTTILCNPGMHVS